MVIALARPVINKKEQTIEQELIPIVIAIDVSKSMQAKDIYPNRLALAKKKLEEIIKELKRSAVGVLFFAKSPFILSPITEDFTSLLDMVRNIDSGVNFDNGSNILPTLEASIELLKDYQNKNLIILTDGGNKNDYSEEIEFAKENKLIVNILSIATDEAVAIPDKSGYLTDKNGKIITVKRNDNIKNLAIKSGGGYITYSLNDSDILQIISYIYNLSKSDKFDSKKIKSYDELFYYPLAIVVFLLLIAFSSLPQIKRATLILLLSILPNFEAKASLLNFKTIEEAKKSYESENYKDAIKAYKEVNKTPQTYYNLANSYYKNKEYKKAIETYKNVVTKDENLEYKKLHNMGNSYAYMNKFDDAIKMYEKALKIKDDKDTKENLETLKKMKQKEQNKKNQENKQNQNKKDDKKEQKQKSENKENQKNDKNSKEKNKDKKDENQKSKQEDKSNKKSTKKEKDNAKQHSELKNQEISNIEEKKWMEILKNQKTPSLLRKYETKSAENSNDENPY